MPVTKLTAQPFEMFSGDTKDLNVTVLNQDSAVVDLTGASVDFTISKKPGGAALVTKTVGSGIVLTDPTNGVMDITLNPADTVSLKGAYHYQCRVTDVSLRETTVLFGTATIRKDN